MATTTPNFGWSVPTSTDLVKDGATAIETLGDAIDASLLDLKGGTSGQVLAKNSGTDMDFVWVTTDDTNAIQNAIVDAKGDLISATAADTPARLAVGTNGHVLTADSTEATGIKWAAPAGGGKVLQVVSTTSTTVVTNSTGTYADLVSVTITPSATSSKVLILFSCNFNMSGSDCYTKYKLVYDTSTDLILTDVGVNSTAYYASGHLSYLHSPSTTSAKTYKVQFAKDSGSTTSTATFGAYTITALEIGA
jgi:hypothetical protein